MRIHSLSAARLAANRANAQLSTGPKTPEGKATVAQNHWRHGLTGSFMVLAWEIREDFDKLVADLRAEHQPSTPTENLLVDRMAQHYWLLQRALSLQNVCFSCELPTCEEEKQLALYLRYQTTNERAFHKCIRELATLRAEARRIQVEQTKERQRIEEAEKTEAARVQRAEEAARNGFESQKRAAAAEARKQAAENRAETLHIGRLELLEGKIALQKARLASQKPVVIAPVELQIAA